VVIIYTTCIVIDSASKIQIFLSKTISDFVTIKLSTEIQCHTVLQNTTPTSILLRKKLLSLLSWMIADFRGGALELTLSSSQGPSAGADIVWWR
jgi:hypothetical protein